MAVSAPSTRALLSRYVALTPTLIQAMASNVVDCRGLRLRIPGSLPIRASVLAGNVRMCALIDAVVQPGATVVDVGANIGVITAYAAQRVGAAGQVVAIEPAADNLAVLQENLRRNGLTQVRVVGHAAGRSRDAREFFLRGEVSAVNSFFPESCYGTVTRVAQVDVAPLDDLVEGDVALVKIDVEGAELDVLAGMPRLLALRGLHLIIEWHPLLQRAAGYAPDALPRFLIDGGFRVVAVEHLGSQPLHRRDIPPMAARLMKAGRPVELFACM